MLSCKAWTFEIAKTVLVSAPSGLSFMHTTYCIFEAYFMIKSLWLKDECPANALRAQNLAGGHFLGYEIRLVFVSLSIWETLGIN